MLLVELVLVLIVVVLALVQRASIHGSRLGWRTDLDSAIYVVLIAVILVRWGTMETARLTVLGI